MSKVFACVRGRGSIGLLCLFMKVLNSPLQVNNSREPLHPKRMSHTLSIHHARQTPSIRATKLTQLWFMGVQ